MTFWQRIKNTLSEYSTEYTHEYDWYLSTFFSGLIIGVIGLYFRSFGEVLKRVLGYLGSSAFSAVQHGTATAVTSFVSGGLSVLTNPAAYADKIITTLFSWGYYSALSIGGVFVGVTLARGLIGLISVGRDHFKENRLAKAGVTLPDKPDVTALHTTDPKLANELEHVLNEFYANEQNYNFITRDKIREVTEILDSALQAPEQHPQRIPTLQYCWQELHNLREKIHKYPYNYLLTSAGTSTSFTSTTTSSSSTSNVQSSSPELRRYHHYLPSQQASSSSLPSVGINAHTPHWHTPLPSHAFNELQLKLTNNLHTHNILNEQSADNLTIRKPHAALTTPPDASINCHHNHFEMNFYDPGLIAPVLTQLPPELNFFKVKCEDLDQAQAILDFIKNEIGIHVTIDFSDSENPDVRNLYYSPATPSFRKT